MDCNNGRFPQIHHPKKEDLVGARFVAGQEWAEVNFVPNWVAQGKKEGVYRFLAIRERFEQAPLPAMERVKACSPRIWWWIWSGPSMFT